MPAKDIFHNTVRTALEKEKWVITNDPLFLKVSKKSPMYIDLAAEKLLLAEKARRKIAVEIKSFIGLSAISEFHTAVGQIFNYRLALRKLDSDRVLYLAIPFDVYDDFFFDSFVQEAIDEYRLKLIVFDSVTEDIVLWKD